MSRTILDCRTLEAVNLTPIQKKRIDRTLDKLGIPKNGTVQINLGIKEKITKDK